MITTSGRSNAPSWQRWCKCGTTLYWDEWANDIARIAQTNISRITAILDKPDNTAEIAAFKRFLKELQDDLNDSITRDEAIEMLAQHIITKPVFDAFLRATASPSTTRCPRPCKACWRC